MLEGNAPMVNIKIRQGWVERFMMAVVFVIFLKPAWIGTLTTINRIWTLAQIAAMGAVLVLSSVNRLSKHTMAVIALFGLLILSTVINGESFVDAVRNFVPYIGMAMITDLWMRLGRGRPMLRALSRVLTAYVYINLATVVLFPGGLYTSVTSDGVSWVKCWFLGYKNPQIRFLLPALVILAVNKWNGCRGCISLQFVITAAAVLVTVILVDSATSILMTVGFIILLVLFSRDRSRIVSLLSPGRMIFFFIAATVLIVVVQSYTMIGSLLSLLFPDKNIGTMSARTYVWNAAMEAVREHWLIGQGSTWLLTSVGWKASHPHNFILYYWMLGGIGAVISMLALWKSTLNEVYRMRNRFIGRVFLAAILMIFLMGIVEAPTEFPMIYAMTAIASNLRCLDDSEIRRPWTLGRMGNYQMIW